MFKLPKMRDYWSVDEGLGNTLIQKTMTREIDFWRFYRIFTLWITSRSLHLKKVKALIKLGKSQSNGASNFGFGALPSLGICINLICIWEKNPKQSLVLVNSCSLPLWESKKQLLLRILWQPFWKSKSHAKAIWGWNLCNWNRQIKLEAHVHFESQ